MPPPEPCSRLISERRNTLLKRSWQAEDACSIRVELTRRMLTWPSALIDAWRRAATIVADEFSKHDPANKNLYKANAKAFRSEMDKLNSWVKGQMKRVPRERRTLATAHAAFGYLCKDHGWKMLPVQGINREQTPSPKWLGEMTATIKKEKIAAVFPEKSHNPKVFQSLAKQTGIRIGKPLIADGGSSISGMFQHNVTTIVGTLAP